MWWILLISVVSAQSEVQSPYVAPDPESVAANMENFKQTFELPRYQTRKYQTGDNSVFKSITTTEKKVYLYKLVYKMATEIMELSGNIMGQGSRAGGSSGSERYSDNSVLTDVRPRFQGMNSYGDDSFGSSSSGGGGGAFGNMAKLIQEYGGLLGVAPSTTTTTTTTTTPPPSPIESLFNTFLGAFTPPVATTTEASSAMKLLGSFLPTTTTTTTRPPLAPWLNMFGVPTQTEEPRADTRLGKINFLELLGMAPRPTTTTTTEAPLAALLNPNKAFNSANGAENIDAILNSLMRGNVRPARSENTSLLSQFFGRK